MIQYKHPAHRTVAQMFTLKENLFTLPFVYQYWIKLKMSKTVLILLCLMVKSFH